jgi:hypothetical protein
VISKKRIRPHLRPTNDSYRVDETYVKIKGEWKYLYRAVDFGNFQDMRENLGFFRFMRDKFFILCVN